MAPSERVFTIARGSCWLLVVFRSVFLHGVVQVAVWMTLTMRLQGLQRTHQLPPVLPPTPTPAQGLTQTPALPVTLPLIPTPIVTLTLTLTMHGADVDCNSLYVLMQGLGGALHTCVAGINLGPSVLKHKYLYHSNHEGPKVDCGGFCQLSLFFWGGGLARGLYRAAPHNLKPAHPFHVHT